MRRRACTQTRHTESRAGAESRTGAAAAGAWRHLGRDCRTAIDQGESGCRTFGRGRIDVGGPSLIPVAEIGDLSEASRKAPRGFHVMIKPRGRSATSTAPTASIAEGALSRKTPVSACPTSAGGVYPARVHRRAERTPGHFRVAGGGTTLMAWTSSGRQSSCRGSTPRPGWMCATRCRLTASAERGWCEFLRDNSFLVGLSLDGPKDLHDANRVDKGGKPSSTACCERSS